MEKTNIDLVKTLLNPRKLKDFASSLTAEQIQEIAANVSDAALVVKQEEEARIAHINFRNERFAEYLESLQKDGLTVQEFIDYLVENKHTFTLESAPIKIDRRKTPKPAKYSFFDEAKGKENTWSGQGRIPKALKAKLDAGAELDDFLINKPKESEQQMDVEDQLKDTVNG